MLPVRVAAVSYLNTIPLIAGLDQVDGLELVTAVPSRIEAMLAGGQTDLGLVSLIDAARSEIPLTILSCGMIGCDGPTLTVRLFSAVPPGQIGTLHADTDSHTSTTLARVVLAEQHGVRPEVVDFDPREQMPAPEQDSGWPEALLLIGDKVVVGSPPAVRYPFQIDLGQAWHELTGLPFVYAAWMCRTERAADPEIATASALLDRQRRRNLMRLDRLVADAALSRGWPQDLAREYVGTLLRFDLDERAREAATLFLHKAASLGFAPESPPSWAESSERAVDSVA